MPRQALKAASNKEYDRELERRRREKEEEDDLEFARDIAAAEALSAAATVADTAMRTSPSGNTTSDDSCSDREGTSGVAGLGGSRRANDSANSLEEPFGMQAVVGEMRAGNSGGASGCDQPLAGVEKAVCGKALELPGSAGAAPASKSPPEQPPRREGGGSQRRPAAGHGPTEARGSTTGGSVSQPRPTVVPLAVALAAAVNRGGVPQQQALRAASPHPSAVQAPQLPYAALPSQGGAGQLAQQGGQAHRHQQAPQLPPASLRLPPPPLPGCLPPAGASPAPGLAPRAPQLPQAPPQLQLPQQFPVPQGPPPQWQPQPQQQQPQLQPQPQPQLKLPPPPQILGPLTPAAFGHASLPAGLALCYGYAASACSEGLFCPHGRVHTVLSRTAFDVICKRFASGGCPGGLVCNLPHLSLEEAVRELEERKVVPGDIGRLARAWARDHGGGSMCLDFCRRRACPRGDACAPLQHPPKCTALLTDSFTLRPSLDPFCCLPARYLVSPCCR